MRFLFAILVLLTPLFGLAEEPEWTVRETPHYRFEWAPGLDGFGNAIADAVEGHHTRIYGELGVTPGDQTRVTLLDNEADMLAVAAGRHDGHRPPEWARGLAYPRTREIYLHATVGPRQLDLTFQHEISHVALGEISRHVPVPRWFSEGLAIKQSEGFDLERTWLLTQAATVGALLPLDELSRGFPESGARAGVAYAQAVHFLGYLQGEFGAEAFRELIRAMREDRKTLDEASFVAYEQSLQKIERDWRGSLEVWWGWVPMVFGSTGLWVIAALILVAAWRRHRRIRVARLDTLRALEAVSDAEDIEIAHRLDRPRALHDPYDGRPPTIH